MSSFREQALDYLQQAKKIKDASRRFDLLCHLWDIIARRPELLREFFIHLLEFDRDESPHVKNFVSGVIEELGRQNFPFNLTQSLQSLRRILNDENPAVARRCIICINNVFRRILNLMSKERNDAMIHDWKTLNNLRQTVIVRCQNMNQSIVINAIKFMEILVLSYSQSVNSSREMFTLDSIPPQHPYLHPNELKEEGEKTLKLLLDVLQYTHVPSSTSLAVINSLANIARLRPYLLEKILPSLYSFLQRIPDRSTSKENSIRYCIKTSLISIIKSRISLSNYPGMQELILECLSMVGAKEQALYLLSKESRREKPEKRSYSSDMHREALPKRPKPERTMEQEAAHSSVLSPAQDLGSFNLAEMLVSLQFTPEMLADVVIESLINASIPSIPTPTSMPATTLDPRLQREKPPITSAPEIPPSQPQPPMTIPTVPIVPKEPQVVHKKEPLKKKQKEPAPIPIVFDPKIMPLSPQEKKEIHNDAFRRILKSERGAINGGPQGIELRRKILSGLACKLDLADQMVKELMEHILSDFPSRKLLALRWLQKEKETEHLKEGQKRYEIILMMLLKSLKHKLDAKDKSFIFLFVEAPELTESAFELLRECCEDPNRNTIALLTMRDIILSREGYREKALISLLQFTSHPNDAIRSPAIRLVTNRLYLTEDSAISNIIEKFAIDSLSQLKDTEKVEEPEMEREVSPEVEEKVKRYLLLYLALCTKKQDLLPGLFDLYVQTSPPVKKVIQQQSIGLIRAVGMDSPHLLSLLSTLPPKAESLMLHFLQVLTEEGKVKPTPQFVNAVKSVFLNRISDPRFLIYILPGLQKDEIFDFLPKLVTLPSSFLKSAMERLLYYTPSILPSELLVHLHLIEIKDGNVLKKTIDAIQLCFDHPSKVTQETWAVVLQQLIDIIPLPQLTMRTVMQTASRYPKQSGFIMGILTRLIGKQIWKDQRLWEGFVKTCKMTQPTSFQVLLHLPSAQLESAFKIAPELKEPLVNYCKYNLHPTQVTSSLLSLLGLSPSELAGSRIMTQLREHRNNIAGILKFLFEIFVN